MLLLNGLPDLGPPGEVGVRANGSGGRETASFFARRGLGRTVSTTAHDFRQRDRAVRSSILLRVIRRRRRVVDQAHHVRQLPLHDLPRRETTSSSPAASFITCRLLRRASGFLQFVR
jgi:hypothetical protein